MAKKNQAKRSGNKSATPSWLWGLMGIALGLVIAAYFFMGDFFKNKTDDTQPQPNAAAEAPARSSDEPVAQEPTEKPKPKYDFYELLPGKEVVIPDADLEAQAQAEERAARVKPAAETPATVNATPTPSTTPVPSPSASTVAEPIASRPETPSNPEAPASSTPTAAVSEPRFLLQAGAFRNPEEAENLKASIAMTGEMARIESAEINGTTVYRVRLGPYATASSLSSAKQALSSHGIQGQAIKVK